MGLNWNARWIKMLMAECNIKNVVIRRRQVVRFLFHCTEEYVDHIWLNSEPPNLQRWPSYGKALDTQQNEMRSYHRSKGTFQSAEGETDRRLWGLYKTLSMRSDFKRSTETVSNRKFLFGHTSSERIELAWTRGSSNNQRRFWYMYSMTQKLRSSLSQPK